MTDFNYTDEFESSESSLVKEAYYDGNTNTLIVNLDPDDDYYYDRFYAYKGVDKNVWDDFRFASSKGKFYNSHIKYGGYDSEFLGDYDDVTPRQVEIDVPRGWSRNSQYRSGSDYVSLTSAPPVAEVVANPDKERYGDGQPMYVELSVTDVPSVPKDEAQGFTQVPTNTYHITFTLAGGPEKVATQPGTSLIEAAAVFEELLTDVLDLDNLVGDVEIVKVSKVG